MVITYANLYPEIQRHLSVIGKRYFDQNGENRFSIITVSSEEKAIFAQYILDALRQTESLLRRFVTSFSESPTAVSLDVVNTRHPETTDPDFNTRVLSQLKSYCVLYTVAEYLATISQSVAQKYEANAQAAFTSLFTFVCYKKPPVGEVGSYPGVYFCIYEAPVGNYSGTPVFYVPTEVYSQGNRNGYLRAECWEEELTLNEVACLNEEGDSKDDYTTLTSATTPHVFTSTELDDIIGLSGSGEWIVIPDSVTDNADVLRFFTKQPAPAASPDNVVSTAIG